MSDPRMAEVREVLRRPTGVEELRGALALLDAVPPSPDLVREVADECRQVFQRLRQQTAEQPDVAVEVLTRDLLPRCLTPDEESDDSYGYRPSHTFGEWLDDLPEEYRGRVRRATLPAALAALGGAGVRNALRLISAVGYWDAEVLGALDALARARSDEAGDHALSARVALCPGLTPDTRGEYLALLHNRIPSG
ncbi:MAG TPA: hypothetical protein VD866_01400, partial [Urbifossiella sp.]|nr:hypothetical protein [Urbifossiella sp.]